MVFKVNHIVLCSFCSGISGLYKKQRISLASFLIDFSSHIQEIIGTSPEKDSEQVGNSLKTDSLTAVSDEIISA